MDKFTESEKLRLQQKDGAAAALMGYLKAERGKVAPPVFNKLFAALGYEKVNKDELVHIAKKVEADEELASLFEKGFTRKIKLDDIPSYTYEEGGESSYDLKEQDVFEQVTNFVIQNEDNNARLRELRKLQRDGAYMKILMENSKKYIAEELKGMPRAKYIKSPPLPEDDKEKALMLLISDWHIGALVYNKDTGGYDFVKLTTMMNETVGKVTELVYTYGLNKVYVFHVGDIVEHISMRNVNQAFEAEFPATEQVAKATRLITDMLINLSKHVHVEFGMVAGNHDRLESNKNDKVYNDTFTYIILDVLFMMQDTFGQLPNVTLIDNREDTYEFITKVAGKTIKVKHGDHEKKKDDVKIPKHIKEEAIDYYIMGHFHSNRFIQEDYHRFHIHVGSTMGANNFSKELNLPTTTASQLIMVLHEGSNTPMFMPLMYDKKGKL